MPSRSSRIGSASFPDTPASDGPRARTSTLFGWLPATIKPLARKFPPVPTCARVERRPSTSVGVGIGVGVGEGVPDGVGVAVGVAVGVGVGVGVGRTFPVIRAIATRAVPLY